MNSIGEECVGAEGYSAIGAVVGATYPGEAEDLRKIMKNNFFLVPGYGAQGGGAADVVPSFNEDGLGALVNSSRGILYHHGNVPGFDGSREQYCAIVKAQAEAMQQAIYSELKKNYPEMMY